MTALAVIAVGVALATLGAFLLFGPLALVVAGLALVVAGLTVPWEELTSAKPAQSPPRG